MMKAARNCKPGDEGRSYTIPGVKRCVHRALGGVFDTLGFVATFKPAKPICAAIWLRYPREVNRCAKNISHGSEACLKVRKEKECGKESTTKRRRKGGKER